MKATTLRAWMTALSAVLVLACASSCRDAETARRPNIVLILADDLGYADIGANGYSDDIATPHIDSLAENGIRFTDGYANHPNCAPSRAGLMSGMYQHRFGFETNPGVERYASPKFGLPRNIRTLAEKLQEAGYATGMAGKWHLGYKQGLRPHERGFDFSYAFLQGSRSYYPDGALLRNGELGKVEVEYLTDALARESVAFIDRHQDEPFFLYLSFSAVHIPLEATGEYEARFAGIADPRRLTLVAMLSAMDDAVGRVMAKLRELEIEEDTLVFFYSDNGGNPPTNSSLNHPLRGRKTQLYEGGIRVPFLMQWKRKLPAGLTYHEPVMGFDCHATALAAAGVSLDSDPPIDGVDLLPFLTERRQDRPHERLFWRLYNQHAARVGDWKLVRSREEQTMLFNLAEDLGEQHDLAEQRPEKLAELSQLFDAWNEQMIDPLWRRQGAFNAEPGGKLKANPTPKREYRR